MGFFKKFSYFVSIFTAAFYIAAYSSSSSLQPQQSLFVGMEESTPPIKIVIWSGSMRNPGNNWFKKDRLRRFERTASKMNSKKNQICKYIQRDENNVARLVDDDEPGHCEFSVSSPDDTITDGDFVVFYMYTAGYKLNELPNPESRKAEQIWVMQTLEPPFMSKWRNPFANLFNWTLTYRRDSDVWIPYGKYVRRFSTNKTDDFVFTGNVSMAEWISGKSKLIAGVISRCQTDSIREELIKQMNSTGIRVDVFGDCGQPTCGRYSNDCGEFWNDLARQYKFYMAFENSLCEDYITEKFWRGLDMGMVPVVYGGGNYELEAPPNSYINVRDFSSAMELMKYLKYLDKNPAEYAKYFEWKRKYRLYKGWEDWCSFCRAAKIYKRQGLQPKKTYENLHFWWHHRPHSKNPVCDSKPKTFFATRNNKTKN